MQPAWFTTANMRVNIKLNQDSQGRLTANSHGALRSVTSPGVGNDRWHTTGPWFRWHMPTKREKERKKESLMSITKTRDLYVEEVDGRRLDHPLWLVLGAPVRSSLVMIPVDVPSYNSPPFSSTWRGKGGRSLMRPHEYNMALKHRNKKKASRRRHTSWPYVVSLQWFWWLVHAHTLDQGGRRTSLTNGRYLPR
ncbi:hypothetical protein LZ30DRAFT_216434 [Colletotrichum cereale]|nr:hypothetical protein LZ30DRAFT_216434 [Colletotrichum cereale]